MLFIRRVLDPNAAANRSMTLTFDMRRKSRLRARLDDGAEAALVLARGTVLRQGDKLGADDGTVVEVRAADELVSTATTFDPLLLARAAYHLGNRHVPLQIDPGRLRFEHDHVLDDLARSLGLEVVVESAPFEPEQGSYSAGHAHASNAHDHAHGSHAHDHSHEGHHRHEADPSRSNARGAEKS
jgi:urease accessory protein